MARTDYGLPGIYNSSPITLPDGKGSALALNVNGQLEVAVVSGGGSGTQYQELATTSPGTGTLAVGRYKATPPTLTDGQLYGLQLDSSGNLKVNAAAMSGATDSVAINDGTNTANVKSIASGNNDLVVGQGFMEQTGLTAGSLNADLVASVDVSNFEEVALQVTGTFTGTLTTQFSNDNSNFTSYSSTTGSGAGTGNTITATGMYRITPMGRYMRVRMTAYTSGTATGVAEFYTLSTKPVLSAQYSVAQTGTWNVGSTSATGSAVPANAFFQGVNARSSSPTLVTNGQLAAALGDLMGMQLVTTGGLVTTAVASGTAANTVIKASGGRLSRVIVTTTNSNAMSIFDNASTNSGTVIGIIPANAVVGSFYDFQMPAANGITVGGNASNPGVTIGWA